MRFGVVRSVMGAAFVVRAGVMALGFIAVDQAKCAGQRAVLWVAERMDPAVTPFEVDDDPSELPSLGADCCFADCKVCTFDTDGAA